MRNERRSLAWSRHRCLVVALLVALVATACGGEGETATDSTATSTTTVSTADDPATTTTTAAPTTTTTAAPTTTSTTTTSTTTTSTTTTAVPTAVPVPEAELPGEDFDFGYVEGTILSVFGVRHDDVLNVRTIPGLEGEIVATLDPLETGFTATGRHRLLTTTAWTELLIDGTTIGWVNRSFVAVEGVTSDWTASLIEQNGGAPSTETLVDLGLGIAEFYADETVLRIEMSVAPVVGDLGEVTYDLVGIGDDAGAGFRFHIFAEAIDEGWIVRTLETTSMCSRGGEPGGLCV